ncbi:MULTISPECIES: S1 family peptidase [Streptomyces]|uniref:S1 family peptidase n=1 Tax=Streptomyces luteosporeus TaxID=173856 RepID=A0ABN3U1P7_9ACTN
MKIRRLPVRAVLAGAAAAVLAAVTLAPHPAAGAQPWQARLDEARRILDARAAIPGTAWMTDPRTHRVVVTADSTVKGAKLTRLREVASGLGEAVTVRSIPTRLTRYLAGGEAIWGGSARCSAGFNVVKDGRPYLLTAGHCGKAANVWAAVRGGSQIAKTVAATFPGHDYSLAEYTAGVAHPGAVMLSGGRTQAIRQAAAAHVDEPVSRSGSTTGVHTGKVTGLDVTVNYQEGRVDGLIRTDVCAEPGDSGGPLFDGDKAIGLTSGGSGNCTQGGETYYQPVPQALQAYGASLETGTG